MMRTQSIAVLMIAVFSTTGNASAADIAVNDAASLAAAIETAEPGDRLLLAEGNYGAFAIRNRSFSPAIEITAAQATAPIFTEIELRDVQGVHFSDLAISFGPTTAPRTTYAVDVQRGTDVAFSAMEFEGAADENPDNDAQGLNIRDSQDVTVENSNFHDLFRGVAILDSTNTNVTQSTFRNISSDGIVGRGDFGVLIEDNFFTDFFLTSVGNVHPDAIQFWDSGASRENRDLTIRGNVILRGVGDPSQGIFIKAGSMASENIVIENNVIQQSMIQGLYLENVVGATVNNNTIAPFDTIIDKPGIEVRAPASGVEVTDNLAISWRLAGAGITAGNITLEYGNPWQSAFAEKFLLSPFVAHAAAPFDFTALTGTGAQNFVMAPGAAIVSTLTGANPMTMMFSLSPPFESSLANWSFTAPDGSIESGSNVTSIEQKTFSASGLWNVQAVIDDPAHGGDVITERVVRVFPEMLVDLTFPGVMSQSAPEPVSFAGETAGVVLSPGGGAAFFNGLPANSGGKFLQSEDAAPLSGSPRIEVRLRLRRPAPSGSWERIISLPGVYDIRMKGDRLRFMVWNNTGSITRVDDYVANISDGAWHDVNCIYDSEVGIATIEIDGVIAASKSAPAGNIAYQPTQTFYFGGAPWNNTFAGEIEYLKIKR